MPKQRHQNYLTELQEQAAAWQRKPGLRAVYRRWYERIVEQLSPLRPVVEIGAGCGNFKQYLPESRATDAIRCGPWIEQIVDAQSLPFEPDSIGNYVLIDCLHHIPHPLQFLSEALRTLKPGGRIVLLEPAVTWGSRPFWAVFHHEPIDLSANLLDASRALPENDGFTYANMGTACLLFERHLPELKRRFPDLILKTLQYSDFLAYASTGGFSYYSLLPSPLIRSLLRWEERLVPQCMWRLIGLRMLIVLEKSADAVPAEHI